MMKVSKLIRLKCLIGPIGCIPFGNPNSDPPNPDEVGSQNNGAN